MAKNVLVEIASKFPESTIGLAKSARLYTKPGRNEDSWRRPIECAARCDASTNASANSSSVRSSSISSTAVCRKAQSTSPSGPEAVEIGAANSAGLKGSVRKATYVGGLIEYTIATELGDLFVVNMKVDRPLSTGAAVSLTLADHGVVPIAAA